MSNFLKFITLFAATFFLFVFWGNNFFVQAEEQDEGILNYSFRPDFNQPLWCYNFGNNLKYGYRSEEIMALQKALKIEGFFNFPKITGYFGPITLKSVKDFQAFYKEEVLKPWKLNYPTGFVGPTTRAKLNKLYGCETHQLIKNKLISYLSEPDPIQKEKIRSELFSFGKSTSYHLGLVLKYLTITSEEKPLLFDMAGQVKAKEAKNIFEDALQDEDVNVKRSAIVALKNLGEKDSKEVLFEALEQETNTFVAQDMLDAINTIGPDKKDIGKLEGFWVKSEDQWQGNQFAIKLLIIENMKKTGSERAGEFLLNKFNEEKDVNLKIAIAEALGDLRHSPAKETLNSYLAELETLKPEVVEPGDELILAQWQEMMDTVKTAIDKLSQ
ncbi:peptidoglycan-binding protein [bacterium]|nr:peptidoglycan-binding protein [bacterium]